MNFFEYYKKLQGRTEKRHFRKKVIYACKIEHGTFYSWLAKKKVPALAQTVIADLMQKPQNELFPTEEIDSII